MAFQNVGTPRFYISRNLYTNSLGLDPVRWAAGPWGGYDTPGPGNGWTETLMRKILSLNPAQTNFLSDNTGGSGEVDINTHFSSMDEWDLNYIAVLNHNLTSRNQNIHFQSAGGSGQGTLSYEEIVNNEGNNGVPMYDGFSIVKINSNNSEFFQQIQVFLQGVNTNPERTGIHIGAIDFGKYFDMPHSPDMNLSMTREYGGVKTTETRGGASLSNSFYTNPPKWGSKDAWQLGNKSFKVGGRRIWNLSFSFLSDSNVFPENPSEVIVEGGPNYWEDTSNTPDFLSEVVKTTNGGQLPFIFQPNTDDNNFAICKFVGNSFQLSQKSLNTYSIKLQIREVW